MKTDSENLSPAQKELVAVGASIGAGCHPCVAHHLKAGMQAGLDGGQLLAAVAGAERITSEAAVLMADHASGQLGPAVTTAATLPALEGVLAAFGAALGANDAAAIEMQLRAALDAGASRSQLREAIETAKRVQENAGRIHVRKAEELLDSIEESSPTQTNSQPDGGCGCGAADESSAAPAGASAAAAADETRPRERCGCGAGGRTEPQGPIDETSDAEEEAGARFGFTPLPAERFDPAAMMVHCRQMFSGAFGSSDTTAEKNETPAATSASRSCSGAKEV